LKESREQVIKIHRRRSSLSLRNGIVPATGHLGSIATIFTVYFFRSGSLQFQLASWADWVVVGVLLFIGAIGLYITIREIRRSTDIVVDRNELRHLLAVARADAEISAETLAGDLSWLDGDIEPLRAVKRDRPTVKLSIYYDRARVSGELLPKVADLENAGIELIPYPHGTAPSIRCTVVDRALPDGVRSYEYVRLHCSGGQQKFRWHELDRSAISIICSHLALLEANLTPPVHVGICGLNNVGKSTLAARLRTRLQERYVIDLVPDHFRTVGSGTDLNANLRILFEQLAESHPNADLVIHDRTLIDNLCFLKMRLKEDETIYKSLTPIVATSMKMFDLIVDINAPIDVPIRKTTHVSSSDRRAVRKALDEFFDTYGLDRLRIEVNPGKFEASMEEAVNVVAHNVEHLLRSQKVADSFGVH
jgi:hypothetical protein